MFALWTIYVRVYFTSDLLSVMPCYFFMYDQLVLYIVIETFLFSPYNLLKNTIYDIGKDFKEDRGSFLLSSIYKPRSPSISSSECSENYHIHVQRRSNRMDEDKFANSISSINVEYAFQEEQKDQVSKANDYTNNILQQCVSNEVPTSSITSSNNMFDIQLSYDIDQALDPKE